MKRPVSGNVEKRLQHLYPVCVAVALLTVPVDSVGRDVRMGGGISTGYEFLDRRYEKDTPAEQATTSSKDEKLSRLRLAPLLTLSSPSEHDQAALRYSPGFRYDFESTDNEVDHDLSATVSRFLTRDWQLKLSEKYLLTDSVETTVATSPTDPQSAPVNGGAQTSSTENGTAVSLSDNEERRRYWTNNLDLRSEYTYLEDSRFSLGYGYHVLRNIDTPADSSYEDYDRHEISSTLGHRFDPVWRLTLSGSYVRGLYDQTEPDQIPETTTGNTPEDEKDLNEYRAGTTLESRFFEHQTQTLSYSFYGVQYDAEESDDSTIHDMNLGWQWDIAKDLMFSIGAGPSYYKSEASAGEWGYNGNLAFRYALERGSIGLTANRGYERQNFTGTAENGLREYWQSRLSFDYRLLEDLTARLFSSYRYEDEETIAVATSAAAAETGGTDTSVSSPSTETFNRQRITAGTSLGYTFHQWYRVALSYDFSHQESEKLDDSFDEHKVALTLSYESEFFNW